MRKIFRVIKRIVFLILENIVYYYKKIKFDIFDFFKKESGISTNNEKEIPRIIVSLTSIPSRFDKLHLCIESIMEQSMKPDKIILYLSLNTKSQELSKKIKKLQKRGLTIEYREDSKLKPHTKYYYVMQEYPNDIIITMDDDIFYNKNVIKNLYKSYLKYPDAISCIRAHKITFDDENKIDKYNNWKKEYSKKDSLIPSHYLCATGVGGVLYPPHCMIEETFNLENINQLSLNVDDLWLKIMQIKGGIKVVKAIQGNYHLFLVKGTQLIALCKSNVVENKNDEFMNNLIEYYNIQREDFES